MKKTTFLLAAVGFAFALQAQAPMTKMAVEQVKIYEKKSHFSPSVITPSKYASKAATVADTLPPEAAYMSCGQGGLYVSYFGAVPHEQGYGSYMGGTNKYGWEWGQVYTPQNYVRMQPNIYKSIFGDNSDVVVTGVIIPGNRELSSLSSETSYPTRVKVWPTRKEVIYDPAEDEATELTVSLPDLTKTPAVSADIDIFIDAESPDWDGSGQYWHYELPEPFKVDKSSSFAVMWEIPAGDSVALIYSPVYGDNCYGLDAYASLVKTHALQNYWFKSPQPGDEDTFPFMPEDNPQYFNDTIYVPAKFMPFNRADWGAITFYWLPVINYTIANEDISSIDNKASIYPIPANRDITITSMYKIRNIKLYNAAGQMIQAMPAKNQSLITLDVSALNNGIYIAHLETEKGLITKKVVIQK